MTTMGWGLRARRRQRLGAVASLIALVACSNGAAPPAPAGSLRGLTGEDSDDGDGQDPESPAVDTPEAQAAGDTGAAPVDTNTDVVVPDAAGYTQYIAFGDSFAAGYGLSSDVGCAQSDAAWPQQVNLALGIANPLIFAACSGATTQDIFGSGPNVVPGFQTGPQSQQLPPADQLTANTLITIQVGGNDIKYEASVKECIDGLSSLAKAPDILTAITQLSQLCTDLDKLIDTFSSTVQNQLGSNLLIVFNALTAAAPNARIVAVGYPHLFDAMSTCTGLLGALTKPAQLERLNGLADAINTQIDLAAAAAGITSITGPVVTEFAGHGMCGSSAFLDESKGGHPNAAGHEAYARAVMAGVPAAPPPTAATTEGAVPATGTVPPAGQAAPTTGTVAGQPVPPVAGDDGQPGISMRTDSEAGAGEPEGAAEPQGADEPEGAGSQPQGEQSAPEPGEQPQPPEGEEPPPQSTPEDPNGDEQYP